MVAGAGAMDTATGFADAQLARRQGRNTKAGDSFENTGFVFEMPISVRQQAS
jgi:hypothetical protein